MAKRGIAALIHRYKIKYIELDEYGILEGGLETRLFGEERRLPWEGNGSVEDAALSESS